MNSGPRNGGHSRWAVSYDACGGASGVWERSGSSWPTKLEEEPMMASRTTMFAAVVLLALSAPAQILAQGRSTAASVPVTIDTFIRAEADTYFA